VAVPGDSLALQTESSSPPIEPGQIIAERYLVGEVLGGGGMGVVYAGTHVLLGTPVAIKLIHPELKDDAEAVGRFVNEARAAAALTGEHIARVFDAGQLPTGEPYLVMEQLVGVSLDEHLHGRGPLPQAEAVAIVLQVCEGLVEAHASALVHRDIKPANLFLAQRPDGTYSVKILDFGIAKQRVRADTPALTNPGKSLGSPWYMSPEQMLTPASVDQRADIWSIGVLLFELLTDRLPFDGESVPQVCANVLATPPPRPSELRGDVAPELDAIVHCCLQKEPQGRFPSVNDLALALRPFAPGAASNDAGSPGLPVLTDPEPIFEAPDVHAYDSYTPLHSAHDIYPPRRPRRRGWPLALTVVALASLFFGGYLQHRDPTLVRRALSATRITMPWDPSLSSAAPPIPFEPTYEPVTLLQIMHSAVATPEPPRGEITYTPIYIATPREPYSLGADTSASIDDTSPAPPPPPPPPPPPLRSGAKGSVEERYGF
jgi:eukaryotic-like serine/threonine-protein kinase